MRLPPTRNDRLEAGAPDFFVLTLLPIPLALIGNVLKPILMDYGLTTAMLVILTGVIGGALTHGLVGFFLGPVVLPVIYALVIERTRLGGGRYGRRHARRRPAVTHHLAASGAA